MRSVVALVTVFVAAALAGCASSTDHPAPATDPRPEPLPDAGRIFSGEGGAEGGPAADAGPPGACSQLVRTTTYITETRLVAAVPVATGGAITDGIYDVSKVTTFDSQTFPPTGRRYALTVRITGTKFDKNQNVKSNILDADHDVTGTMTLNGTTMDIAETCPTTDEHLPYSATPTTIKLYYLNQEVEVIKR